jgi:hypothetical protein
MTQSVAHQTDGSSYCSSNAFTVQICAQRSDLSLLRADAALDIAIAVNVRLHNLVEIGLVHHGTGLGAFGLLLEILAQKVEIELAFLDLGTSL